MTDWIKTFPQHTSRPIEQAQQLLESGEQQDEGGSNLSFIPHPYLDENANVVSRNTQKIERKHLHMTNSYQAISSQDNLLFQVPLVA